MTSTHYSVDLTERRRILVLVEPAEQKLFQDALKKLRASGRLQSNRGPLHSVVNHGSDLTLFWLSNPGPTETMTVGEFSVLASGPELTTLPGVG